MHLNNNHSINANICSVIKYSSLRLFSAELSSPTSQPAICFYPEKEINSVLSLNNIFCAIKYKSIKNYLECFISITLSSSFFSVFLLSPHKSMFLEYHQTPTSARVARARHEATKQQSVVLMESVSQSRQLVLSPQMLPHVKQALSETEKFELFEASIKSHQYYSV